MSFFIVFYSCVLSLRIRYRRNDPKASALEPDLVIADDGVVVIRFQDPVNPREVRL